MKCVACGSTALVEGTLMETSGGGTSIYSGPQYQDKKEAAIKVGFSPFKLDLS